MIRQIQLRLLQKILVATFFGSVTITASSQTPDTYYVTSLADYTSEISGSTNLHGTLRHGIETAKGPRIILFDVSGYIDLKQPLVIRGPGIWIAGQTAPDHGICLRNHPIIIAGNDIRISHLRVRLGTNSLRATDAISVNSGTNIVIENCSASWSIDECLSATWFVADLTVRRCFITESLHNSIHSKGAHGFGSLIRPSVPTAYYWHYNLYAHHASRNPRLGSYLPGVRWTMDFRNNVIYNWGYRAGYSGPTNEFVQLNYVGNALIKGPNSSSDLVFYGGGNTTVIFQADNIIDLLPDGEFKPRPVTWSDFGGEFLRRTDAFPITRQVHTDTPSAAYLKVLMLSGAKPWARDSIDSRIVQEVLTCKGKLVDSPSDVGGWPDLPTSRGPVDTDKDGLPDYWETTWGSNPHDPGDAFETNTAGVPHLYSYLEWLNEPHAIAAAGSTTRIDLQKIFGGVTNMYFKLGHVTTGYAKLDADGHTLELNAPPSYRGLLTIRIIGTHSKTAISSGPLTLRILVVPPESMHHATSHSTFRAIESRSEKAKLSAAGAGGSTVSTAQSPSFTHKRTDNRRICS